jgi:hypothetical protein
MKELKSSADSNREAIELFLVSEEGSVQLTDKQREILQRWSYADELIRQQEIRKRETQAAMIMRKFSVSRQTAYQDIVNAEAVFASSTPLNKRYRIQVRIEFLECKIDELYGMMEPDPNDPEEEDPFERIGRIKQNKEYIFEATQLEKVLQKYYDIYPDIRPARSPKTIVFNIQNSVLPTAPMSKEEALEKAKNKIINLKARDDNGGSNS